LCIARPHCEAAAACVRRAAQPSAFSSHPWCRPPGGFRQMRFARLTHLTRRLRHPILLPWLDRALPQALIRRPGVVCLTSYLSLLLSLPAVSHGAAAPAADTAATPSQQVIVSADRYPATVRGEAAARA